MNFKLNELNSFILNPVAEKKEMEEKSTKKLGNGIWSERREHRELKLLCQEDS
jgi:hypothetical protein